jgi:hypothetical protein
LFYLLEENLQWRRTESADIPAIRALWTHAGYGFPFPDLESEKIISSWVAVDEGRIVCWSGAQLQVEIISIMDAAWGSPHERMKVFRRFHPHIAAELMEKGFERAFCTVDPKYPRFARRLLKSKLGWFRWWETLWITKEAFRK